MLLYNMYASFSNLFQMHH